MKAIGIFPGPVFSIGPVSVTDTVIYTWLVMFAIAGFSYLATRRLTMKPGLVQEVLEAAIEAIDRTSMDIIPGRPWEVVPVIGTLWIFIGVSNLAGLVPGLETPTADINTTLSLAVISYVMSHAIGIRTMGFGKYMAHYTRPVWVLLPFHLMAEFTRTLALAVRLFGNMLSGELVAVILLGVAGLFAPVPFDILHIVIGIIQAYIFGMLTLVFTAEGMAVTKEETEGG